MNNLNLLLLQFPEPIKTVATVQFYVLLFSALFLIYIKINNNVYFKNLFNSIFSESAQFDSSLQTSLGNISSGLLQFSYILLTTLGISFIIDISPSYGDYFTFLIKFFTFYTFQLVGFYLISFIIGFKSSSFVRNRLVLNEINAVFLFFTLLLALYFPFSKSFSLPIIICFSGLINLIGSVTYLTSKISNFHIILYLCMLEIIPVLLLLKFI